MADLEKRFYKTFSKRMQRKYAPPSLTPKQRKAQIKSIMEKKERPKLPTKTRKSKWTIKAENYFGEDRSKKAISIKTGIPQKALKEIVERGEGAYYSSGSRPGQTPSSWGIARMYAVLFGSPGARKADQDIIKKYNIPILEMKGSGVKEVKEITETKDYPRNYPKDALAVMKDMSFSKGKNVEVMGTMSIRSLLYASDFDCVEIVDKKSPTQIVKEYQQIIRNLLKRPKTYIGDIKCGEIQEWRVIDESAYFKGGVIYGYNRDKSFKKLQELYDTNVISKKELEDGQQLLVKDPSPEELRTILKILRFSVLRWKTKDILNGYLTLRTGEKYPLEKAIQDPALFKMDVIALMNDGMFQEFSMIYDLRVKGRRLNIHRVDTLQNLSRDIVFYSYAKNWFKVLKRLFSYFNYIFKYVSNGKVEAVEILEKLYEILNSDLGILYSITQDLQVLSFLIENEKDVPMNQIKEEVEGFVDRLANVYSVNAYLAQEPKILAKIHQIVSGRSNPENVNEDLLTLDEKVSAILSRATFQQINEKGLLKTIEEFIRGNRGSPLAK